jgi:hypothetical protein
MQHVDSLLPQKFADIEASYLSAELNVQAVVFIVLIAVPAYGRYDFFFVLL